MVAQNGEILRSELWHLLCMCILYTYMCACELSAYIIYIYIYICIIWWLIHDIIMHIYIYHCIPKLCLTKLQHKTRVEGFASLLRPVFFTNGFMGRMLRTGEANPASTSAQVWPILRSCTTAYVDVIKEISVSTCILRTYNVIKRIQTNHPLCKYIVYIHLDKYFWI